jgi:hypothetical protein
MTGERAGKSKAHTKKRRKAEEHEGRNISA